LPFKILLKSRSSKKYIVAMPYPHLTQQIASPFPERTTTT